MQFFFAMLQNNPLDKNELKTIQDFGFKIQDVPDAGIDHSKNKGTSCKS